MYGDVKKTHAVSVGMPGGLSFTYDLNQGGYLQAWRGKFLDATQMWHDRGEPQTSAPMGVTIPLNDKFPLAFLSDASVSFPTSLPKSDLQYKGYSLNKVEVAGEKIAYPIFMYEYKGLKVQDISTPSANSEAIVRHLTFEGSTPAGSSLFVLLAEGKTITDLGKNHFAIDNQQYYVTIPETSKAIIRDNNGVKQLVMPLAGLKDLSYQLIF
jgi:archaellum component FlaF (FlaF/FlaG flagellin family)